VDDSRQKGATSLTRLVPPDPLKMAELDSGLKSDMNLDMKSIASALTPVPGETSAEHLDGAPKSLLRDNPAPAQAQISDSPAEFLGQTIGEHYRLDRLLGHGGMSCVYLGVDLRSHQEVAVKFLHRQWSMHQQTLQRFEQEGQALSRLNHKNIVKVFEYGFHQTNIPFMVMELVQGTPLSSVLEQNHKLSIEPTVNIAIQVCQSLDYAHSLRIIHRDLKPANIMVCLEQGDQWTAKLLDFGIAKIVSEDQMQLTHAGQIFGSPFYMSPEQCLGLSVDRRTDFYSLGCVIFECLTGAPPYSGENPVATMSLHQSGSVPTLKEGTLGERFPPLLEDIVAKLLSKNADDRYQNSREIIRALSQVKTEALPAESSPNLTANAGDIDILRSLRADCANRAFKIQDARRQAQAEENNERSKVVLIWVGAVVVVCLLFCCLAALHVPKDRSEASVDWTAALHAPKDRSESADWTASFFPPKDRSDGSVDELMAAKGSPSPYGDLVDTVQAVQEKKNAAKGRSKVAAEHLSKAGQTKLAMLSKRAGPMLDVGNSGGLADAFVGRTALTSSLFSTDAGRLAKQTGSKSDPEQVSVNDFNFSRSNFENLALSHVRSLRLQKCRVHGALAPLALNRSLLLVELSDCDIQGPDLAFLPRGVRELRLIRCNSLTDDGMGELLRLPSLHALNLSGCEITDASLAILGRLNLETLDLTGTQVSPKGVRKLLADNPRLVVTIGDAY